MSAIEECLPAGSVQVWAQPAPERLPVDHAARCEREGCSPDGWKRADVALEFTTGKIMVLDVRTTNTLSASAPTDPDSHLRAQESAKAAKYKSTSIPSWWTWVAPSPYGPMARSSTSRRRRRKRRGLDCRGSGSSGRPRCSGEWPLRWRGRRRGSRRGYRRGRHRMGAERDSGGGRTCDGSDRGALRGRDRDERLDLEAGE